jgi:hypothetical protein
MFVAANSTHKTMLGKFTIIGLVYAWPSIWCGLNIYVVLHVWMGTRLWWICFSLAFCKRQQTHTTTSWKKKVFVTLVVVVISLRANSLTRCSVFTYLPSWSYG